VAGRNVWATLRAQMSPEAQAAAEAEALRLDEAMNPPLAGDVLKQPRAEVVRNSQLGAGNSRPGRDRSDECLPV
jgi:hypothetical protein